MRQGVFSRRHNRTDKVNIASDQTDAGFLSRWSSVGSWRLWRCRRRLEAIRRGNWRATKNSMTGGFSAIISKSQLPFLASLQRKDTRLGKRQARDWGSQYGDTSMVFDRISGVGPVCCRTEGKGTSGEFSAEL